METEQTVETTDFDASATLVAMGYKADIMISKVGGKAIFFFEGGTCKDMYEDYWKNKLTCDALTLSESRRALKNKMMGLIQSLKDEI